MKPIEERERIVRDLINTFNDRDELHEACKSKMKEIITYAIIEFTNLIDENPNVNDGDIYEWINKFVEERFRPAK